MYQVSLVVKYTNLIYIFVNIYENIKQSRKIAEKLKWVYLQNYLYLICWLS